MSAMTEEIGALIAELKNVESVIERGMRTYYRGELWGVPVVLVYSRWGKVAAATTATSLIAEHDVGEIIFTGVAGGVDATLRPGDVVIATELVQHDMDPRPIFPRHEVPLLGRAMFVADPLRRSLAQRAAERFFAHDLPADVAASAIAEFGIDTPRVVAGVIASGDKFFSERSHVEELLERLPDTLCVEMEGAAVAQVCFEYQVPCTVIRTISDAADETAPIDFPRFVATVASGYSRGIVRNLLQALHEPTGHASGHESVGVGSSAVADNNE